MLPNVGCNYASAGEKMDTTLFNKSNVLLNTNEQFFIHSLSGSTLIAAASISHNQSLLLSPPYLA